MSPDFLFWLALALKLVLTAGIVVTASFVTERAGPLIGALVVTLPVTMWPAYVFLALEHDVDFVAASVVGGLAMNAASGIFMLVYILLAQWHGLAVSLITALAAWFVLALVARGVEWTPGVAILANVVIYAVCIVLTKRFREVRITSGVRQWYDLPLRTALVCALMGTVLLISNVVGPVATGFVAVFPVSTSSTILILHPRLGGQATAAVAANGLFGFAGIGAGLTAMHFAIPTLGITTALALLLVVAMVWNMTVWIVRVRALSFERGVGLTWRIPRSAVPTPPPGGRSA